MRAYRRFRAALDKAYTVSENPRVIRLRNGTYVAIGDTSVRTDGYRVTYAHGTRRSFTAVDEQIVRELAP